MKYGLFCSEFFTDYFSVVFFIYLVPPTHKLAKTTEKSSKMAYFGPDLTTYQMADNLNKKWRTALKKWRTCLKICRRRLNNAGQKLFKNGGQHKYRILGVQF